MSRITQTHRTLAARSLSPIVRPIVLSAFAVAILLLGAASADAQYTILHSFAGGDYDGAGPTGALTVDSSVDGDTLYGLTPAGGAAFPGAPGALHSSNTGTIFKMSRGSTVLLRSFDYQTSGTRPYGSLIRNGTTLYGMTSGGVEGGFGEVFKINTDGSGFDIMHSFNTVGDGARPQGSLYLLGSTLYGMTLEGGNSIVAGSGTIFKINTDGTDYAVLHLFDFFDPNNGARPWGDLTSDGTALYGMTSTGGAYQWGTVFKINLDGSGFTLLHSFPINDPNEGTLPFGSLIRIGTTLYGMTAQRGSYIPPLPPECIDNLPPPPYCGTGISIPKPGIIFKINTDGSGYTILHGFETGPGGGGYTTGSLASDGELLYGMTAGYHDPNGPPSLEAPGTVFQIKPDGSCLRTLHSFAGYPNDGAGGAAGSALTVSRASRNDPTTLYGMTVAGGPSNLGTVFRIRDVNVALEANAGLDQTVEATSSAGARVSLSGGTNALRYHWTAPGVVFDDPGSATPSGVFPLGQTVVTLTAADDGTTCFTATDEVLITVQDTTPPAVACTISPTQLFPPAHQKISTRVAVCATDATTLPAQMSLGRATASSSEPDNAPGLGDGDTVGDTDDRDGFIAPVNIASKLSFRASTGCFEGTIGLRAERAGTKKDRIYTISTGVKDSQNREGLGSCRVVVPHP